MRDAAGSVPHGELLRALFSELVAGEATETRTGTGTGAGSGVSRNGQPPPQEDDQAGQGLPRARQ